MGFSAIIFQDENLRVALIRNCNAFVTMSLADRCHSFNHE